MESSASPCVSLLAPLIVALLCSSCTSPEKSSPLFAATRHCSSGGHIALWRARGDHTDVYLFGSIHVGKPEFYPLPPVVEEAFASSKRLVVEFDSRSESSQRALKEGFAKGRYADGSSERDVLAPPLYDLLVERIHSMGLPEEQMLSLPPWVLAPALSVTALQALGYEPDLGVDRALLERAEDREILELESASEQIALLRSLDGEQFLTYTLLALNTLEADVRGLVGAWFCGDTTRMEQILLDPPDSELADTSELIEVLFDRRNIRMADRIEDLLRDSKRSFVVVGAGHLIGKRGIVALLRERGWPVTRE